MKLSLVLLISVILLVGVVNAAPVKYQSLSCSGDQLCTTTTTCDLSAGGCTVSTASCQKCPDSIQFCPDGSVAKCSTSCQSSSGISVCGSCTPECPQAPPNTLVLPFKVYVKKTVAANITPQSQSGLAGTPLDYNITLENMNPIKIDLLPQVQAPDGWSVSSLSQFSLDVNQSNSIVLTITSNQSSSAGSKNILVAFFSPQVGTSVFTLVYKVSTHSTPSITILPQSANVIASGSANYSITVTNNDGPQFDPATALTVVNVPEGWTVDQLQSGQIKPGETATYNVLVTANSTPDSGANKINVNVTMFSNSAFAESVAFVSACGDGICQNGEVCAQDCPAESTFKCSGRCEKQTDYGLMFSAVVQNFLSTKFLVCSSTSTPEECEASFDSGSCGAGQSCLCGNSVAGSSCSLRCVDANGAYYLGARGVTTGIIKSATYEYNCPVVNLPELVSVRDNLTLARDQFEQSRSVLQQNINSSQNAGQYIPCFDGLGIIIENVNSHLRYLNDVINHPSISNTTLARQKTEQVKNLISSTFNKYCRAGSNGALKIIGVDTPSSIEKDSQASITVRVQNSGSVNYYGYSQCDFTSPQNAVTTVNGTCRLITVSSVVSDQLKSVVNSEGDWGLKCRVIGSLKSDCSSEVHDQTEQSTFNVYSRETFVSAVQGTCSDRIICSVTTSRPTSDVGCRLGAINCVLINRTDSTSSFACPRPSIGTLNITGFVTSSANTLPVDPVQKVSSVRCGGIGDGIVEGTEQCELPDTLNNTFCAQSPNTCDGKRTGSRLSYGYCNPNDQCIPSSYTYSCDKTRCAAVCSDGETRNFTIVNTEGRTCTCTQQCGATCDFNSCLCEIPPKQLSIAVPASETVLKGQNLIAVYANNDSSINIGINSLSPTCLGDYPIRTVRTLDTRFETTLNTTFYPDGMYYLCAKSVTNVTSIKIYIRNNESSYDNSYINFIQPSNNNQINGSALVVVTATSAANVSIGLSQLSSTCLAQYNIQTVKTSQDRFETTLNTTSYPDGVYYLCAKAGNNLTSITVVIKNVGVATPNITSCSISITDKSCIYNTITNRFNVVGTNSWTGGDHSHLIIENDEGLIQTSPQYRRMLEVTGEGSKSLRAVVHSSDHIVLCYNQTTVMCVKDNVVSGNSNVVVTRSVQDQVQQGDLNMEFVLTSSDNTQLQLTERLQNGLIIKQISAYGNDSQINFVGPSSVTYDGRNYNAYTFTIGLSANKITRLDYVTTLSSDGQYNFVSTANYGGQSKQDMKVVTVSSCKDTSQNNYVNAAGQCQFMRACDAEAGSGWNYVEKCPSAEPLEKANPDYTLFIIIGIIVLALILYTQREKISQWLEERSLAKKYER